MKKTFRKDEKLRSRSTIERLFQRGNAEVQTFYIFPFRVLYIKEDYGRWTGPPVRLDTGHSDETSSEVKLPRSNPPKVLFSVSKRNFKRAVDRNLIRRRCREAYRLHKSILTQHPEVLSGASVAFLYLAKEISTYDVIEKSMIKILRRMTDSPAS